MKESLLRESKILQTVYPLSQKYKKKVYLVGGALRDLFLKNTLGKDFDFVAPGDMSDLAKALAQEMNGHVFLLDGHFGNWRVVLPDERKTEVDFSRMQGEDISADLRVRDFTVNSMAIDLGEFFLKGAPCWIDPLGGLADIDKKVLRANSEESLREDPLRMLRAFRFSYTLKLQIEEETFHWIRKNKKLISHASWERIRNEFFAALNEPRADEFLKDLYRAGILEELFPEIPTWVGLDQGVYHDYPLWEHALRAVEAADFLLGHWTSLYPDYAPSLDAYFSANLEAGISRRALFKFIALFHDSGKPSTRGLSHPGHSIRFLDHDQEGQKINTEIARRMKLSRKSLRIVAELTRQHMRILSLVKAREVTPRAKVHFFRDLEKEGVSAVFLALPDMAGSKKIDLGQFLGGELPEDIAKVKKVCDGLLQFYYREFSSQPKKLFLNGREVMEALGASRGKEVGVLLGLLREAEIAGKVKSKPEALEFLKGVDRSKLFR